MTRPAPPWKAIALEALGYAPDTFRHRLAKRYHHVRALTTDAELDAHLAEAAERFRRSDDEGKRFLLEFEFAAPPMPPDPFSPKYREAQWDLYQRISRRKTYEISHEEVDSDLQLALQSPYPYNTGSATQVANYLAACSYILRFLDPNSGQRVVEFGPGWGQLTLSLAMMSVDTTAVEVSPIFAELLRRRGDETGHLTVVESDMLEFTCEDRFDAAIFFESFHHCSDHLAMLEQLHSVVADDGLIVFAAEPVTAMPYPWGLRLDGLSLWSTRKYGWLELGFDPGYFDEALKRSGWGDIRHIRSRSMTPLADIISARRRHR